MADEETDNPELNTVVQEILTNIGVSFEDMDLNEMYTVDGGGFKDLTVEKVWDDVLSIAHYSELHGDLLRDPEVLFRIEDGKYSPIEYRHDSGQGTKFERNESGIEIPGVLSAMETWAKNLRAQGHVERAKEVDPDATDDGH